jgi:hypothetical protein
MGTWTGEPTAYAYKWLRDTATVGADSPSYEVVADDGGHSITCIVTASNGGGSADSPPSNPVAVAGANGVTATATTHSTKAKK